MGIYYFLADDGSFGIGIVLEGIRVGINLERDLQESGWYLVAKAGAFSEMVCEYGELPLDLIQALREWLDKSEPVALEGER